MAGTKPKANRGPERHPIREPIRELSKKNVTDGATPSNGAKRKRPSRSQSSAAQQQTKRAKPSSQNTTLEDSLPSMNDTLSTTWPVTAAPLPTTLPSTIQTTNPPPTHPPIFLGLTDTHEVITLSVISSTKIEKRVSKVLEVLGEWPVKEGEKERVVMLYAKAPVVSKLISVAEIWKREVDKKGDGEKGGKWFSYCVVGVGLEERKESKMKRKEGEDGVKVSEDNVEGDAEDGSEDEEAFETMKTPFERAIEGKPKIRNVPVMSLYLSRVRIEGLRKLYGEQTNAK